MKTSSKPKSKKERLVIQLAARFTQEEARLILDKADDSRRSISGYMRDAVLAYVEQKGK
jgi:hypothetical protein